MSSWNRRWRRRMGYVDPLNISETRKIGNWQYSSGYSKYPEKPWGNQYPKKYGYRRRRSGWV